jgi:hypothetical protein
LAGLSLVGRIKPGVTLGQVNAETRTILTTLDSHVRPYNLFRKQLYGIRAIAEFFRSRPADATFLTVRCVGFFAVPLFLSCKALAEEEREWQRTNAIIARFSTLEREEP